MRLLRGICDTVVAVGHNSGLGSSSGGGVPWDIQSSFLWFQNTRERRPGRRQGPFPLAQLPWPCERGAGPQVALFASLHVLQRGGADWVPELSNSFYPVLIGGCDMDHMELDVLERGWCGGVRDRADAPIGAAGASSPVPLCWLEWGSRCSQGWFCWKGPAVPLLCQCC